MLSVIIPSRSGQWLQKTVDDLLAKAKGEIEVIVVYDGRWSLLRDDPRVIQVHHGELFNNRGMRSSINAGMAIARGEYVMKIDEQCAVDQGFDKKLAADCEDNWVVIPRRYRLDAENWRITEDGRPPIDYMQVDYPYQRPLDKTCGLHGAAWKRPDRADIMIDDTPTMQGSCYFMKKSYWDKLFPNGLDDVNYGTFTQEAQEISFTVWLTGGRVVVNKKTWYAHWHKGKHGKGYGFSNNQYKAHLIGTERGRLYCINHWLNAHDYLHDFAWYIDEKFPGSPGWGDWKQRIQVDREQDFSTTYQKEGYKPSW
jgi:glycosyltransferase involved in cell wall biosynthesis